MNLEKNITIPAYMLAMIVYNKGNKTASDAQRVLDITYSSILDINKSLFKLGWAEPIPKDGKSIYIRLTNRGSRIAYCFKLSLETMEVVLKEDKNVNNEND